MPSTRLEKRGPVAVLTLTRPDARNAIDLATMEEIRAAVADIEADPSIHVSILTAEGSVFCAGMDLAGFLAGQQPGITAPDRFAGFAGARRRKPFIAAVNGPAIAGGMEIVLACEMAVAVPRARFALPEVQLGLIAAGGGAARLPVSLPPAIAAELLLTGDAMSAERALAVGLINRMVPEAELMSEAMALAGRVAAAAPGAIFATMEIIRANRDRLEAPGWAATDRLWPQVAASPDAQEGPRAFVEKRRPVYRQPE